MIVAAYDRWKEECVDHFDGMFAFAVWDEKKKNFLRQETGLAKNHFLFLDNEQFVFASEMKALWAAGIERKVNLKLAF